MEAKLSECCNAPVWDSVYYWLCSECGKACDLKGNPSFPPKNKTYTLGKDMFINGEYPNGKYIPLKEKKDGTGRIL